MKKGFYLLCTVLFGVLLFLSSGCKRSNELDRVDILVTASRETYENDNSVGVSFTVNNNSDENIVVSYFDKETGEEYLTVDESPYSIIPPQTTNSDFGFGYEYSNEEEYSKIVSMVNADYHFRVYLCDKDYLNSEEPIHKNEYRDIVVPYYYFK